MVTTSREEHNNYYRKVVIHIIIIPRKNFCLYNVLKSSHSMTCLPENLCKFSFHGFASAYMTLLSMTGGLRFAVRVQWRFPCDNIENYILFCLLFFISFLQINSSAFVQT
ncbi:hypothetical protein T4C_10882 [Trichinella pseudospiralis]|uniref:Uncharacterized protein n=1 Tax=Trichinella pseudospiralis TaxID=6337 RepID=A0A0V1JSQ8_TRIPS|nr:hypothetical protein T4C_10882 [Trichinella pseudospiralis]